MSVATMLEYALYPVIIQLTIINSVMHLGYTSSSRLFRFLLLTNLACEKGNNTVIDLYIYRLESNSDPLVSSGSQFSLLLFAEKETALADLYHHLESLNELQLRTVIINCVDFCKHQLSEDFSPLVQVLQVNNYKIAGDQIT